ncbi:glucan endo-1,3-alpha-glucosidase [Saitozyma sp. JCM 24511]|nr:glucan endo-1,3-alpha-glucosidase [Saitozyma sp. JCM 24511]
MSPSILPKQLRRSASDVASAASAVASAAITASLGVNNAYAYQGGGGFSSSAAVVVSSAAPAASSSTGTTTTTNASSSSSGKQVFAHFMIGIVEPYTQADHEADQSLAKSKGITGFALNIGTDDYTVTQLTNAYAAAQAVGFNVFISFDFNWYSTSDVSQVASIVSQFVGQPAQFLVDGMPFVSSFIGDGFDWSSVASSVGKQLYVVPYFQPDLATQSGLEGLFSWDAWPGQGNNVPILANMTTDQDYVYIDAVNAASRTYMAPVSATYNKNWAFYSEELWKIRWDQILSMGSDLNFIEIITWNDFGESHYIGPYDTPHTDDGSSAWASGLDHTAMLDMAVPYINAFKAGQTTVTVQDEMLVYWYRPHLKSAECDSTDLCGAKPTGWDFLEDSVFVTAMTISGGTVTVTSGSNAAVTTTVDAGVQIFQVPMGVGTQSFSFQTNSGGSGSGSGNVSISADCWNGNYNYNFHSGSITV